MSRWTEADLARFNSAKAAIVQVKKPKPSKYHNVRTEVDGISFSSRLEADYYQHLMLRWKAGDLLWFAMQVPFGLEGGVRYVADFVVVDFTHGRQEVRVIDTTGMMTQVKKNKLKQMKARWGITVEIVTKASLRCIRYSLRYRASR